MFYRKSEEIDVEAEVEKYKPEAMEEGHSYWKRLAVNWYGNSFLKRQECENDNI